MAGEAGGAKEWAFVVKFFFVGGIPLLHLFAATSRGPAAQEDPLKNFSLILTLSVLLSAAANAWSAPADTDAISAADAASNEGLPKVVLSEELMYRYLSAELAHQRGEHFAAYATMLSIARGSGDPRLARRALEFALSGSLTMSWHQNRKKPPRRCSACSWRTDDSTMRSRRWQSSWLPRHRSRCPW